MREPAVSRTKLGLAQRPLELGVAGRLGEVEVVIHEPAVLARVEALEQSLAPDLTLAAPGASQRLDRFTTRCRELADVGVETLEQHVDVTHVAQHSRDRAQLLDVAPLHPGPIGAVEDFPGGTHTPGGHAHAVQLLGVVTQARPGLEVQHPREVHPKHLPAGLAERVVCLDAG